MMDKKLSLITITNWKTFEKQCDRHGWWGATAVIDEATTWAFENGLLGRESFDYDVWEWKDLTGNGFKNQVATTVRFTLRRPEIDTWEDDDGNEIFAALSPEGDGYSEQHKNSVQRARQNAEYSVELI